MTKRKEKEELPSQNSMILVEGSLRALYEGGWLGTTLYCSECLRIIKYRRKTRVTCDGKCRMRRKRRLDKCNYSYYDDIKR